MTALQDRTGEPGALALRDTSRARARRGLGIYLGLLFVGTGICEGLILRTGDPIGKHGTLVAVLMWVPAAASLVARLALREGFADVAFTLRGRVGLRMLCLGWLYPLAVGLIAYGIAWGAGLASFAAPTMSSLGLEHASSLLKFVAAIGLFLTAGTAVSALTALGEELGWRGFMLTRLVDAGFKRPLLLSGVIWSAWHLPLVLSGQYASGPRPLVSAVMFVLAVIAAGYVAARVRLESGSIWPAVAFHASWNAMIQGAFNAFTNAGSAPHSSVVWTGESGVLVVAINVLLAALLMARPWPGRRSPSDDPMATFSFRNG